MINPGELSLRVVVVVVAPEGSGSLELRGVGAGSGHGQGGRIAHVVFHPLLQVLTLVLVLVVTPVRVRSQRDGHPQGHLSLHQVRLDEDLQTVKREEGGENCITFSLLQLIQ